VRDIILAPFLTGMPDSQRGIMWPADIELARPLLDSAPVPVVIFANEVEGPFVERVEAPRSIYFDRWRHAYNYLWRNTDIRFAWCVDTFDVVVLNDPFPHMQPDTLYCGSEPEVVGCAWMLNGKQFPMHDWIKANANKVLLNCGLVGGDRQTMLYVCRRMGELYYGMTHDMASFNYLAYEEFPTRFVTGPLVHTLYKAEETESSAWFKHK
jgi:hypothetical protein